jgi:hypothetical protein
LQRCDQLLAAGDYPRAYAAANHAMLPLGRLKREIWERAIKSMPSSLTSPLAASFDTLPAEMNFESWVAGQRANQKNQLVGGDCENLQAMLDAGWRHFEHPQPGVQTGVELSPVAPYGDRFSLHLRAANNNQPTAAAAIESPPVWVTSSPVEVAAGDIVCIRGQVRFTGPNGGVGEGLKIVDSLGGEPLALRFGQTDGWKEFVIYRAAANPGSATVTFAMAGLGDASIDNVTISPIRRGSPGSNPMAGGLDASRIMR